MPICGLTRVRSPVSLRAPISMFSAEKFWPGTVIWNFLSPTPGILIGAVMQTSVTLASLMRRREIAWSPLCILSTSVKRSKPLPSSSPTCMLKMVPESAR